MLRHGLLWHQILVILIFSSPEFGWVNSCSAVDPLLIPDLDGSAGMEILMRGPIHEAFAAPILLDPGPSPVVDRVPPGPVAERPPGRRLEGDDVIWIPGYWVWEADLNDFLWVSGIWRLPPPGHKWAGGYWHLGDHGQQWVSGFWAPPDTASLTYRPRPPRSLEQGPIGASPSPGDIWSPGTWTWQEGDYRWLSGEWIAARRDWLWTPSHNIWTPRGYAGMRGYWDHGMLRRGLVFAPVHFRGSPYDRPDFSYTPRVVIPGDQITSHLFIGPEAQHYYFGDYYAPEYADRGIRPWYEVRGNHQVYDPLYVQTMWEKGVLANDWARTVEERYRRRAARVELRSPRTYAEEVWLEQHPGPDMDKLLLVMDLDRLAPLENRSERLIDLDERQRQEWQQQADRMNDQRRERVRLESEAFDPGHGELILVPVTPSLVEVEKEFLMATPPRFELIDVSDFPIIHARFILAGASVDENQIVQNLRVWEDGTLVAKFHLTMDPAPLELSLVLDQSGSMTSAIKDLQKAAATFVDELPTGTRMEILAFSDQVVRLAEFTTNHRELLNAIESLNPYGATALMDAILEGVSILGDGRGGRRVLVAFTDGQDQNAGGTAPLSRATALDVVRAARRAGIPLYLIGLGPDVNQSLMSKMARLTAGQYLHAPSRADLIGIYQGLIRMLKGSYRVEYSSPNPLPDGTSRLIEVESTAGQASGRGQGRYASPYSISGVEIRN